MFLGLFDKLRQSGIPVTLREYLDLCAALKLGLAQLSVERFYTLARLSLVKSEAFYDRFDQAFAHWLEGVATTPLSELFPAEWLEAAAQLLLDPEELAKIEQLGGFEEIIEALKKRIEEQRRRHSGGSRWIGSGGRSPFGAFGANPAGIRIRQGGPGMNRAIKVWEKREFKDLDDQRLLGARNFQMALRRLRAFGREGAPEELDIDGTIAATARNAQLSIRYEAPRRNRIKILLLLDIGGSMDTHIQVCERLFSAARAEFQDLHSYYFHNCVYERLWSRNPRRQENLIASEDLLRHFRPDTRLVFVGDAAMSPYEVLEPGGSIEHWNQESGATWMKRFQSRFPAATWLNPTPKEHWAYTPSIEALRQLMDGRMHPLTPQGLRDALADL